MYNRHYRFEFHDTAFPEHYTLLRPDFVVLCYDVSDRRSLVNVQHVWFRRMVESYMKERDDIPVMLLGLKRDLRVEKPGVIYPQEVSLVQGCVTWAGRQVGMVPSLTSELRCRGSRWRKNSAVIGTPSVLPRRASS